MLVHLIADYGHGDLAFAEVAQRIKRYLPGAEVMPTPVPSFSTLAAGFCVAQLGLNPAPVGTMIFHNVAPRADDAEARARNAGERLAVARLPNGVVVLGVNAGYAFSFIRDHVRELRWVAVPAEGSQFRSRDLFPQALAALADGQHHVLGPALARHEVPDVPTNRIAYIDGFGNLKTTIAYGTVTRTPGALLSIRIAAVEREATATDGSFEVKTGQMAFAPGSSGWRTPDGRELRWMEVFLRGGNAWEAFGRPPVGASRCTSTRGRDASIWSESTRRRWDGHRLVAARRAPLISLAGSATVARRVSLILLRNVRGRYGYVLDRGR